MSALGQAGQPALAVASARWLVQMVAADVAHQHDRGEIAHPLGAGTGDERARPEELLARLHDPFESAQGRGHLSRLEVCFRLREHAGQGDERAECLGRVGRDRSKGHASVLLAHQHAQVVTPQVRDDDVIEPVSVQVAQGRGARVRSDLQRVTCQKPAPAVAVEQLDLARFGTGTDQVDQIVLVQPPGGDVTHAWPHHQVPSVAEGAIPRPEKELDLGLVEQRHRQVGVAVPIEVAGRGAEGRLACVRNGLHGVDLPAAEIPEDRQVVVPPVGYHEVVTALAEEIGGDHVRGTVRLLEVSPRIERQAAAVVRDPDDPALADGDDVAPTVPIDVLGHHGEGVAEELDVVPLSETATPVPREDRDRHGAVVGGDEVEKPVAVQVRERDAARADGRLDVMGRVLAARLRQEDAHEAPFERGPAGDDVAPAVAVQVAERDAERLGVLDEGELADGVAWRREATVPRARGAAAEGA